MRPATRFDEQLDTHQRGACLRRDEHLDDFAVVNGFRRTRSAFGLLAVAESRGINGRGGPAGVGRPAMDHQSFYRRGRRAAAIVTEPYPTERIAELRRVADSLGLGLYAPPNPLASFWYPGWTVFLVIAREPVRWLPEQLAFEGGDPETIAEVNRWLGR